MLQVDSANGPDHWRAGLCPESTPARTFKGKHRFFNRPVFGCTQDRYHTMFKKRHCMCCKLYWSSAVLPKSASWFAHTLYRTSHPYRSALISVPPPPLSCRLMSLALIENKCIFSRPYPSCTMYKSSKESS